MKKIAGKIAMILILVILVNSFTGCQKGGGVLQGIAAIGMLCLLMWLSSIGGFSYNPTDSGEKLAILDQDEKSPFMEALCSLPEAELTALTEKLDTLPKAELASLSATYNSLPEAKRNYLMRKINSLSKAEVAAMLQEFNSTPEMEIASSIKKINSMPEKKLASLVNVLQHIEVDVSQEKDIYVGLRFQY